MNSMSKNFLSSFIGVCLVLGGTPLSVQAGMFDSITGGSPCEKAAKAAGAAIVAGGIVAGGITLYKGWTEDELERDRKSVIAHTSTRASMQKAMNSNEPLLEIDEISVVPSEVKPGDDATIYVWYTVSTGNIDTPKVHKTLSIFQGATKQMPAPEAKESAISSSGGGRFRAAVSYKVPENISGDLKVVADFDLDGKHQAQKETTLSVASN